MSSKPKIIWIDDDSDRIRESENLGNRLNVNVEFIDVKDEVLLEKLNGILSEKQMPYLILMDHRLTHVNKSGFEKGSTAAEVIREKWPECPIVCITAAKPGDIDWHKKSIYEEILQYDDISDYDSVILSIGESFQELQKKRPGDVNELINILKPPEDDVARLHSILPRELKRGEISQDESLLLSISKWVRYTLINKPGFLYDRLWAATLLGIKEESFKKIESIFADAKYRGIFKDKKNERWWQSKLRDIIFSQFPGDDSIYTWELGRKLPGIDDTDFSHCDHPDEDHADPPTVAYTDEKAEKRVQRCLRHTVPHPNFEKSLFFEEIRMSKPAE